MTRTIRASFGISAIALVTAITAVPLHAQQAAPAAQADTREFDIPAQSLAEALRAFARAADVQLAYSAELVASKQSSPLQGRFRVVDGLARLLAGTGLTANSPDGRTFSLTQVVDADGARVLGVVRVQGAQSDGYFGRAGQAVGVNGVNGSRDITATEGTGSFTSGALTIGSKAPQALKDVPQSISVLTSERLEQQNVTDFSTAMRQLPGVSLAQGDSSLQSTYYSRGFAINSIQVDGGAPLSTSFADGLSYFPQIDMSVYDHVELLRGAAGTFNGYGSPGGTVNLVRKKPLDRAQFLLEGQAGSWSNYRVVADASSPLALDGALRGRLVMTWQDREYFYDIARENKTLIYGIVELDVTPGTLVTAGGNYTQQDSVPWQNGLPRYLTGGDLMLPRSTCLCFDWNRWAFETTEIFGGIEQRIGQDWTLKLNLTRSRQASQQKLGYSVGAVNDLAPGASVQGPQLTGGM